MKLTPNIFVPFLIVFCPALCAGIRVLRTDPTQELPDRNGQAELLNSSLSKYPEFTICVRFKTYQFSWHRDTWAYHGVIVIPPDDDWLLGAYVTHPCDDFYSGCTQRYKDIHGRQWRHSGVVGYVGDGVYNDNFPAWQPAVWNSACITATDSGSVTIVLNGETVFQTMDYELKLRPDYNIVLMNDKNGAWGGLPMHGEVSDVNVWSRILTDDEIIDWEECEAIETGNVVDWETARLSLTTGVTVIEEEKENICSNKGGRKTYKALKSQATFDGIVKQCNNIGGQIAVAENEEALRMMEASFRDTCDDGGFFYTGFTDRQRDTNWINVNTGEPLAWNNWADKNPVNLSKHDCITSTIGKALGQNIS